MIRIVVITGAGFLVAGTPAPALASSPAFAAAHPISGAQPETAPQTAPSGGASTQTPAGLTISRAEARDKAPRSIVLKRRRPRHRTKGSRSVDLVNRSAVREPDPNGFVGAAQIYPWSEGALYRLYAAPEEVSDIALQPGETLVSVAAGDTVRWIIGDTSSGSGSSRRVHVLVKPSSVGLKTNLVIATNRRVYHVEALSTQETAMSQVSWTYPDDALLALQGSVASAAPDPTANFSLDTLNFDYRIEGDKVAWRPLQAFDDGHQVFIEFPASIGEGEAPPLFVSGEHGEAELVNYRVRGRYYIVDRLFGQAELRLGEKHQRIVRIIRVANGSGGRKGS